MTEPSEDAESEVGRDELKNKVSIDVNAFLLVEVGVQIGRLIGEQVANEALKNGPGSQR